MERRTRCVEDMTEGVGEMELEEGQMMGDDEQMDVDFASDLIYEEVIHEEIGDDKENGDSDVGESDFPEDDDIMEITRRRISQDREGNCYCGKDRNLNIAELLCASCNRWFHESCIGYQLGKLVPFMTNYIFMCKNCSPTGLESFKRSQAQFSQMCITAVANLTQASVKEGSNRKLFCRDKEIIPYFEMHWDSLTTTRRATASWQTTVAKTLLKDVGPVYIVEDGPDEEPGSQYFGFVTSDLTSIKPNYDIMIKTGQLKVNDMTSAGAAALRGRGGKRRTVGSESSNNVQIVVAKKTRGDVFSSKVFHGYPPDHPYNKDNFRYLLAEPDPNAPFRQEFDETSDGAKPIPGFLYRVMVPSTVLLALHDRAPQLKISDDRLSVTGDKGYSMVRATHGVYHGSWYFEAKIVELPEGGATRIGFGQSQANLQGPLGYDQFAYSWRSRYGTAFHVARGKSFAKGGYGLNDVIGLLIILPEHASKVPDSLKDKPLVRFKSHLYYEEKDTMTDGKKKEDVVLPIHPGSKIIGFRNGKCFGAAYENISAGTYYPTISLFRSTIVRVNFGPEPWITPETDLEYKMFSEKAEQAIVEQTVADLVYLTENDGKLTLDSYLPS